MSAKLENYQHLGETMIKKFASRGMEAFYCATSADAVKKVRKLKSSKVSLKNSLQQKFYLLSAK